MNAESQAAGHAARNETIALVAFFLVGMVLLPLGAIAWRGASNLENRVRHLNALRISMQSADRGRQAIDDPERDPALLADFLYPAADRLARARAFYQKWRSHTDEPILKLTLENIQIDDAGHSATVTQTLETRHNGEERIYKQTAQWEKSGRAWYLREVEEVMTESRPVPSRAPILPGQ